MSAALSMRRKYSPKNSGVKRPKVVAIVPAAGCGSRLGMDTKKPFVLLGGKPLVSYALKTLDNCSRISGIIVAAERPCVDRLKAVARRFKIRKLIGVIVGGKTRSESVRNCINRIGSSFDIVLIHDAARPFVTKDIIERSINIAMRYGAAIAAVPESDTVKFTDNYGFVQKTLPRSRVFRAQTPQVFKYAVIKRAYLKNKRLNVTDDASLVETIIGVRIVEGSYKNMKITTREDFRMAEALL